MAIDDRTTTGGKEAIALDASNTLYSKPLELDGYSIYSAQLVSASGTRAGTVSIEVSNDGTNWETIASFSILASTAFAELARDCAAAERFVRVKYVPSAGTGTLNVYFSRKRS